MIAFYLVIAVVLLTIVSYTLLGRTINKVRDAAQNHPEKLRSTSVEEALVKVSDWQKARDKLWPQAMIVIVGLVVMGMFWD